MSEDNSEKKHQPSAKKLEQLRKDGSFLRAKEFYSGLTLIVTLLTIFSFASQWYTVWGENFIISFKSINVNSLENFHLLDLITHLLGINSLVILPLFLAIIASYLFFVSVLGRLQFPEKFIQVKWERLSIAKNLKRIYSSQTLIELAKAVFKCLLFTLAVIIFYQLHHIDIIRLQKIENLHSLHMVFQLLSSYLPLILVVLLLIGVTDGMINYWQYQRKIMMTSQEVKDESKDTDGNPELKKRVRRTQYAIAMQRLQKEIPTATVILTNPTHYAIALRYNGSTDSAPVILAKGIDFKAQKIRELAAKHGVPIYQAPELARAIYKTGRVGSQIHPDLYMAVALVLSYIMQLKEYQLGRGKMPNPVTNLTIPEHLS